MRRKRSKGKCAMWKGTLKFDFLLKVLLESPGVQLMCTDGQIFFKNTRVLRKCFMRRFSVNFTCFVEQQQTRAMSTVS